MDLDCVRHLVSVQSARDYMAGWRENAGLVSIACAALAVVVQIRFVQLGSPDLAYYGWVLCLLGAVAALSLWFLDRPAPSTKSTPIASRPVSFMWTVPAAGIGLVCAAVSAHLVVADAWNAQWLWLAGMATPLLILSVRAMLTRPRHPWSAFASAWRELTAVGTLFLVALAIRVFDITSSPPLLHGDEASCGLYGRLFNTGTVPLLSISWYGLPMLSYAISGVGLRLFGDDLTGLRLINALIGSLSIVLLYYLGKEWFGKRAGMLAAILLCFAFLHLELSRDGIHYIQGPTCITLSLYLCTLWLKRGGILYAYLAGLSFVLDMQVYWSARAAPLLVAGVLVFLLWRDRPLLFARWREILWVGIGTCVAGLPLAALFRANPGTFNSHQGDVSIFSSNPNTQGHIVSQYGHISTLDLIHIQAWKVLTTFIAQPDSSSLFQWWPRPMLDDVMGALIPAAFVLALLRWKRWEYAVCLAWFGSIVLAGIITIDPPIWPRMFALLPAAALLLGCLFAEMWERLDTEFHRKWIGLIALVPFLALMIVDNLHNAFVDYPDVTRQVAMGPTYVGNFLQHAPDAGHTVMLSDGSYFLTYEPIQFLAPQAKGCTLLPKAAPKTCPIWNTSRLFILLPGRVQDLPALERAHPGGKVVPIATYSYGTAHIIAYELPRQPPARA